MKFYRTAILAAALAIVSTPSFAWKVYVPPVRSPPAVHSPSGGGSGGGWKFICTANPGGFFVCVVAAGIIVHELRGPACASKSKYNVAHGYDHPTLWRPLCRFKRDPAVKPAKFMPHGK